MTKNPSGVNEVTFDEACRFMIAVGKAAHSYGSTTGQIESFLSRLIGVLGYHGTFRATVTEIFFAFQEKEDSWQRVYVEGLPGAGQELNRLARVGELVDAVEAGRLDVTEATRQLAEIDKIPHPWGNLLLAASFVVAGAGFAIILGGGLWDMILSGLFGLAVFFTIGLVSSFGGAWAADWLPVITSFVAGILAAAAKILVPESNSMVVIVCAVVVLFPGFTISVGLIELISNHVVSGMANLMNGLLYLFKMAVGAWLGFSLVALMWAIPPAAPASPASAWWLLVLLPLVLVALCFAFQTAPRDSLATAVISGVTFLVLMVGSGLVGGNIGMLIAALIGGILCTLWSNRTGRPITIPLVPVLMLLVSGSIGFRGLLSLTEGQITVGLSQFVQMFVVAIMIFIGLLVSISIVRPKTTF